jgi:hypothetical protein
MKKSMHRRWHLRRNGGPAQAEAAEQETAAPPAAVQPVGRKRRLWLFLLICLLGSSAVSFVAFKYIIPSFVAPSIPRELVGTWEVLEGDLKGATLEFRWYGTATAVAYKQGKKETVNFSVQFDDDVIFMTSKQDLFGKEETLTQTILALTDDELVIRDADWKTYRMTRVRH